MKKITSLVREELDGKFVFFTKSTDSSVFCIAKVFWKEGHSKPYYLQDVLDGSSPGSNHMLYFKYSYAHENSSEIYEIPESLQAKLNERVELMNTLTDGSVVFYKSRFREISKKSNGWYAGGEKIGVLHDFIIRTDPAMTRETALNQMFKEVLETEGIDDYNKENIRNHISSEVMFSGSINLENPYTKRINAVEFDSSGRLWLYSNSGDNLSGIFNKIPTSMHYGYVPLYAWSDLFMDAQSSYLETMTLLSNKFSKQLQTVSCDEGLKNYMLSGEYYHKMQYVDFDIATQMITFTPKGKDIIITDGNIDSKNRQSVKVHKFFNTILKGKGSEYDIKCFADKFIAFFTAFEVKYYKGKKFAECYSKVNTRDWATTSCMDRKAENFFEMYTSSRFRLGVIYRESEVVARFIEVTTDEGFVYNDRIYYKDETVLGWYNGWVDSNKLNRKAKNTHDSKRSFYNITKGEFEKTVTVTLSRELGDYSVYPYLDTLSYGKKKTLSNADDKTMRFRFLDQYGKCERLRSKLDIISRQWIDENEAVQITYGQHMGEFTVVDNLFYSVNNGGHCLK